MSKRYALYLETGYYLKGQWIEREQKLVGTIKVKKVMK